MTEKESAIPIPWYFKSLGLSKREFYASLAMQALITQFSDTAMAHSDLIAKQAVEYADKLMAELKKPKESK